MVNNNVGFFANKDVGILANNDAGFLANSPRLCDTISLY